MKKRIVIWLTIALICLGMCANAENVGIDVLVRGQTAIMRIDKEWLQTYANQDVDPQSDSKIYHSEVINESMLKYHLESAEWYDQKDDLYEAFMADYAENGYAVNATIYEVYMTGDPFIKTLAKRNKENCWYIVFCQTQQPDATTAVHYGINFQNTCRYRAVRLAAQEGIYKFYEDERSIPDSLMSIRPYNGDPDEVLQRGELTLEVFHVLDTNVIMCYQTVSEADFIEYAYLMVDDDLCYSAKGYLDGDQAAYCCVMNDIDFRVLLDGMEVNLAANDVASLVANGK